MFFNRKNNIIVTIGNHNVVVTKHDKAGLKEKFFIEELNEASEKHLKGFFANNKKLPIYFLLDTTDQNYKRKSYPNVRESYVAIKNELATGSNKNVLTNFLIVKQPNFSLQKAKVPTTLKKLEAMLILAGVSETTSKWIDFIVDAPNHIAGIYLSPIEMCQIYQLIEKTQTPSKVAKKINKTEKKEDKKDTKDKEAKNPAAEPKATKTLPSIAPESELNLSSPQPQQATQLARAAETKTPSITAATSTGKTSEKVREVDTVYYLTLQTRASGTRQVVFSNGGIIFTRVINLDYHNANFTTEYERDIHNTFEYLKRILPDILLSDLKVLNVLPSLALEKLKDFADQKIHAKNYTPEAFAKEIGYPNCLPEGDDFCDLLLARIFSQEKKRLKFSTPKIAVIGKLFLVLQFFFTANLTILALIFGSIIFTIFNRASNIDLLEQEEARKIQVVQQLSKFKKSLLTESQENENIETAELEKIIEISKIDEVIGPLSEDLSVIYDDIKFLKNFNIKLENFAYSMPSFDQKNPNVNASYNVSFNGKISNESGNIEDFFKEFDDMDKEVKRNLTKYDTKHSELPRNIDFTQKYYTFPIDFTLTKSTKK